MAVYAIAAMLLLLMVLGITDNLRQEYKRNLEPIQMTFGRRVYSKPSEMVGCLVSSWTQIWIPSSTKQVLANCETKTAHNCPTSLLVDTNQHHDRRETPPRCSHRLNNLPR
eukprot:TCONS_00057032-protein